MLVPSDRGSPPPLPAHLLHNLAHIELNAVDLAWDTVARFADLGLPDAFYEDFARQGRCPMKGLDPRLGIRMGRAPMVYFSHHFRSHTAFSALTSAAPPLRSQLLH